MCAAEEFDPPIFLGGFFPSEDGDATVNKEDNTQQSYEENVHVIGEEVSLHDPITVVLMRPDCLRGSDW